LEINHTQIIQRRRLISYLFTRLHVQVKEPCLRCAAPFLVERPRYNPDRSSLCPDCKPRPDHAPNAAVHCDCGQPAAVVVYLSIYHPESPHRSYEPTPLCETCAIDELLARIKGQV
jgi:hypothetical protein